MDTTSICKELISKQSFSKLSFRKVHNKQIIFAQKRKFPLFFPERFFDSTARLHRQVFKLAVGDRCPSKARPGQAKGAGYGQNLRDASGPLRYEAFVKMKC